MSWGSLGGGEAGEVKGCVCMCAGSIGTRIHSCRLFATWTIRWKAKKSAISNEEVISFQRPTAIKDLFVINCNRPRMTNNTFITHTSSSSFFAPIHSQYIYEKSNNITRIFSTSTMRWKAKKSGIINEEVISFLFQNNRSFSR